MMFGPLLRDIPTSEWVALSADETRVVAHGQNLEEVIHAAAQAGESEAVITGIPRATLVLGVFHDA